MKVVVTGGCGFIGSHVVDHYLASGCDVLVVDDLSSGRKENLESAMEQYPKTLQLSKLDICASETKARVKAFAPELVVHLAAQMNVRRSVAEPQFDAEKNVVGTVNLLEAARESGCKVFVFSSTGGAIYGEQEHYPAEESHPIKPECPYGISKRAGELYLEYYARAYGLQTRSLRFANVYGPRQNPKGEAGVVAIFSERILSGHPLTVNGDGGQTRDFVHVYDVVQAVALSASQAVKKVSTRGKFEIFNVGCGVETSINELVETMRLAWKEIGEKPFPDVTYADGLPGEQRRSVISYRRIENELGWKPEVTLVEGLKGTILSFQPAL
jgi:UDP-glucose 4-epimerase